MKPKLNQILFLVVSFFISSNIIAQNKAEKLKGYYTGFKNNTYTFSHIEVATGEKETIQFQYVKPELIETFNLKKEFFEGVFFEITYFTSNINGNYTYRIIDLKQIKESTIENESIKTESSKEVTTDKLEAYFIGFKNNKYSFSYTEKATGKKETIFLDDISDSVSNSYDLQQEFFEGVHFEVTYITDTINGKLIYIIVDLKEIQED